jgi:thiamine pyrophosphate-dependent acetolactate synthase large subunit-like protein
MVAATGNLLDRRAAVTSLLADRGDLLVVSGLGSSTYDANAAGDNDANFYLWGAMGSAALIGLGLAQAQPKRRVLVITGDGEQLMGLGGLATIAIAAPKNLTVAVIDNGHFGETGMQQSHTGLGIDIAAIAATCGFAKTGTLTDLDQVAEARKSFAAAGKGPQLFVVKVRAENVPRSLPPRDAVHLKNRFRAQLGLKPS